MGNDIQATMNRSHLAQAERAFVLRGRIPGGEDAPRLLDLVRRNGVVIVEGFPTDPAALLRYGRLLGKPQQRYVWDPIPSFSEPMKWVTDVRFRPDANAFTHRCGPLRLHTARAAYKGRPQDTSRLFMMLMADPGQRSDATSGRSMFSRLAEAIDWLRSTIDDEREVAAILETLRTTSISTEDPYPDIPEVTPILSGAVGGVMRFRYWEHILEHAKSTPASYALSRFDEALTRARFEYSLKNGDLVLLDNHRVAHGRRAFPGWVRDAHGRKKVSSRLLYNLHVFID